MARDEARHAGFLSRALVAEGIDIDLPSLSGKRPITWFPLGWVLSSVYLSEKIGYWCYILIDRHLRGHRENDFVPLFVFLNPGVRTKTATVTLQHADQLLAAAARRLAGRLLSRFFLWSVFLTHSLTVCERGNF